MNTFRIKQGDTDPPLEVQLLGPDEKPLNLQGATVRFRMEGGVSGDAEIVDLLEARVRYNWRDGDTAKHGIWNAEFPVTFVSGRVQTVPNSGYVTVVIERMVG